jgi:hypothetical protein
MEFNSMQKFKTRWEIQHNWQLLFPILGLTLLVYSSYKIAGIFFNRHEKKWIVTYKWEMIRIFLVFAITGSSSVFISKPIMKLIGITKENLNVFVYWLLYIIIGFIFYQILLITIAWIFGQYSFFRDFLKRLAKRIGLGILIKE